MKYIIMQIKNSRDCDYSFMDYNYAKDHGLDIDDYDIVYSGEIEAGRYIEDTLENLFYIFNCKHPVDFRGHSLSVSDIIKIGGEYWYTDTCGFKLLK